MTPEDLAAKRKKARDRMRKYRAENREKVRRAQREYDSRRYAENLDISRARKRARYAQNAEKERERARKWRAENPKKALTLVRDSKRKWRATNPEKARELVRKWIANHPEVKRANDQRRRASLKTSTAKAPTAKQLKDLLARPCHYCGDSAQQIDHYIPLARGGTHTLENLRPACAACNLSKGAKLPGIEWTGRAGCVILPQEPHEALEALRALQKARE